MAVTALLYGKVFANAFGGETAGEASAIDLLSNTIKVSLHTASYTPNQDTHEFKSDLTNELVATGYTAGGVTLGSKTLTYTAGTNVTAFDAADAIWTGLDGPFRYAVVADNTPGSDATRPLIMYVDLGADIDPNLLDFELRWNAAGLFTVTVA
jgi:hypothetical protein